MGAVPLLCWLPGIILLLCCAGFQGLFCACAIRILQSAEYKGRKHTRRDIWRVLRLTDEHKCSGTSEGAVSGLNLNLSGVQRGASNSMGGGGSVGLSAGAQ